MNKEEIKSPTTSLLVLREQRDILKKKSKEHGMSLFTYTNILIRYAIDNIKDLKTSDDD